MVQVFTAYAKYIMLLMIVIITIDCFMSLRIKNESYRKWKYYKINICTALMHMLGFFVLFMHKFDITILIFYISQSVFYFVYLLMFRKIYKTANLLLLNMIYLLSSIGFIMLTRLNYDQAIRQFMFLVIAGMISLIIPKFIEKLTMAKVLAGIGGVIGLALLAVVLVKGKITYGANLSINIAGFAFQPSEFVKLSFILLIAMLFRKRNDFIRVCFATLIAMAHVGILVLSNDLGGALIFFMTYLFMLYVATKTPWYFLMGFLIGCVAAVVAYELFSHVQIRVAVWLDPWSVIDKEGYQIAQSLFAIASGGFTGVGLYMGLPTKIPVVTKDFIFSAICEEMGGLFGLCLIFICLCVFLQFVYIASKNDIKFYKLIGIGIASQYIVQVFLNIGGGLKMIPSTGVTLPFVSYGGSSLIGIMLMFAVMQGLVGMKKGEELNEEEQEESIAINDETQ